MSLSSLPTDLVNLINSYLVSEDDMKKALAMWWPEYEDTPKWEEFLHEDLEKFRKIIRYGGFPPKDPKLLFCRWRLNQFHDTRWGFFAVGETWMDDLPEYTFRNLGFYNYLERLHYYLESKGYRYDHSLVEE